MIMEDSQSSYRQIIKATSLFGGVQFLSILISIIRSKIVAIFLGPTGLGITSLLNSSIALISAFTSVGLDKSAVKSISMANFTGDNVKIATEISILKRLIWFTGILGTMLTIILSSWLSKLTFNNTDYTFAFIWISITLLFMQLTNGQLAILQGLRKLQFQAKANLYGSFLGLLFTVPLYYYYGIKSIVPTIIVASLIVLLTSWYYSNKVKIKSVPVTNLEVFIGGKEMIRLGFSLSFINILSLIAAYALQIVISHRGGVIELGLFSAGFAIINSYVGLIFTAISTDYYPRLSSICGDNDKVRITVIQQALIAILIITPIIIIFLTFAPFIIRFLYSLKFISIISMVSWGILGMLFKAVSWSMGYILIAKGDSKIFMKTSLFFNILFLIINIIGYYSFGLEGLGITFALNYIIHFLGLKIITNNKYNFYFDKEFYKIFMYCIALCMITFLFSFILFPILKYCLMIIMITLSLLFSLYELDKKINLKEMYNKLKK